MATINISLPDGMYKDIKKAVEKKNFTSVSEFFRDSVRKTLYPEVTENGFTKEFEDEVLRSEAESNENDYTLETDEEIKNYFRHLILPNKKK